MSYPPPPGLNSQPTSSSSTPQPHPSLPARPPPSAQPTTFNIPARGGSHAKPPGTGGYNGFSTFGRGSAGASTQSWSAQTTIAAAGPPAPSTYSAAPSYNAAAYQGYPYQQTQPYYQQRAASYTNTPPQTESPFALPGQSRGSGGGRGGNAAYDPEYEANIAQWQAAYAPKDDANTKGTGTGRRENANTIPLGTKASPTSQLSSADMHSAVNPDTGVAAVVAGADGKQKTVVRSGGGQTWQDSSLLEWDPSHFRIFVGNLAGEVTDESLLKAFAKYSSVQKARVVRDKRTTKSKGYGFVSFSNGDDYFQAARDMNGKYIGSHPVLIKRSTTEIKATVPKDHRKNNKHGKGGGKDRNGGAGGGHGAHGGASVGGGANTGAGVKKNSNKTRGGLKILG